MRTLEHRLARVRLAARRLRARAGSVDPASVAPSRLVLDLSKPGEAGDLTAPALRALLVDAVHWRGPLPVAVHVGHRGDHPHLPELVRFAHRLECPTLLVADGPGLSATTALALVDRGLAALRLRVAGVTDAVQQDVLGTRASDATDALVAFVEARRQRRVALDIEIAVAWVQGVDTDLLALAGWARQLGADGFRLLAPHDPRRLPRRTDGLAALPRDAFHRTSPQTLRALHAMHAHRDNGPGLPRSAAPLAWKALPCPVGGQRLVVRADHTVFACPHQPAIGRLERGLVATWARAGEHLQAIHGCSRRCAHLELAPEPA
jgi:hypothetical protein